MKSSIDYFNCKAKRKDGGLKLSVLTATYNCLSTGHHEALIRCIMSVSTVPVAHEHLIVDGASIDGTLDVLRELESRISNLRIISEPDTGVYNALNKGVRDAQGKWLYVLGCDDQIVRSDSFAAALAHGDATGATMVSSPVYDSETCDSQNTPNYNLFLAGRAIPHQGLLVRTDALKRYGGYDETYQIAADYDSMVRMILNGEKLAILGKPYAYYADGGISCDMDACSREYVRILQQLHGVTEAEAWVMEKRRIAPLHMIVRYWFHQSEQVRLSARYMLLRWLIDKVGFLKANGALRWH